MDNLDRHEVQIRFTRIDRTKDTILFTDYDFQVNDKKYFYPASTIKFPTAVMALEKLNQTEGLTVNSRYYIEGDSVEDSFAQDISKIFAVSDNHANNRLFEFLGPENINKKMYGKGIQNFRLAHRLGFKWEGVTTRPLVIYLNDSTTTLTTPHIGKEPENLVLEGTKKGSGFYVGDSLMAGPFDFGKKNYFPISSQHGTLKRVIFPELFPLGQRFDINGAQRDLLLKAMYSPPADVGYDPEEFYDGYCKFFMYGDTTDDIPDHIKIYNKVGYAYGTLTDCAYIQDTKNNVEFMLTATILVNSDGIFNDNQYEYEEVGIPFLAELGRHVYQYELQRKK
ncbi:MAG: serine hydrolase [Flavobacteriaceae bacterium]